MVDTAYAESRFQATEIRHQYGPKVHLLDDPFAELDRRRTQRILALLDAMGAGQCVLCVPREDEIPSQFTRLARWQVRDGVFTPQAGA